MLAKPHANELADLASSQPYYKNTAKRKFTAKIAWGKRFEPWVLGVKRDHSFDEENTL